MENSHEGLYMNGLDSLSVTVTSYTGDVNQRWEIIYISNGYYHIKNCGSGKYLTAPDNNYEGSSVEQSELSSSKTDRQLWRFVATDIDPSAYYIQAKSQEAYDLYAASDISEESYGYDLIQSYTSEFTGYEEWILEYFERITLIAINNTSIGHSHNGSVLSAEYAFAEKEKIPNAIYTESMTNASVISYLQNSDFFLIYMEGEWGIDGTYVYLDSSGTNTLHTRDIYNYSTGSRIDMSGCDAAIFAGCYTSHNATYNLPLAAVHAGANCAIGFVNDPGCDNISRWLSDFSYFYVNNFTPEFSAEIAVARSNGGIILNDISVYSQTITQGG